LWLPKNAAAVPKNKEQCSLTFISGLNPHLLLSIPSHHPLNVMWQHNIVYFYEIMAKKVRNIETGVVVSL